MIYNSFRIQCAVRVILIALTLLAGIYLVLNTTIFVTSFLVLAMSVIQVVLLIRYVEQTNRHLTRFLHSIRYSDFAESFTGGPGGKSFDNLARAFSDVVQEFRKTRSEREEQYRYLQTIIQHIGLGIVSFEADGKVDLINNAAKKLLKIPHLKNVNKLKSLSSDLVNILISGKPGENKMVKIDDDGEIITLIIYMTQFRLRQRSITLVSMQNIESELAEQEMAAWQKLIRVLTHEIMNSITPIASLASTVNDLLSQSDKTQLSDTASDAIQDEIKEDIRLAAETIEKRSNGLLHFVNAYRNLTRIPTPEFTMFSIDEFLSRISQLMKNQIDSASITFIKSVKPDNLKLVADPELVEQVVINLIVNAVAALKDTIDPQLSVSAGMNNRGRVVIAVTDNGPGLDPDIIEKIFTPFFTTKKDGSGIGLSLSRQIMRLHKGTISVQSEPENATTFTLRF